MDNWAIHECLKTIPGLEVWPEVLSLFPDTDAPLRTDWALPFYSLRAAGQSDTIALPIAAALACIQISIMIVDDILDDDPRGKHVEMGSGRAANLALALQAAAHLAVDTLDTSTDRRHAIATCLQTMALATASGQEIDTQPITGEDAYWRLVSAKSTPFYAAALESGAILGGTDEATQRVVRSIGVHLGEIIQIMDDLEDAFQSPPKPDWKRQNNNLVILFAKTAEHPERTHFLECLSQIDYPGHLQAAQQILINCGAVSYALYEIIQRYHSNMTMLRGSTFLEPQPIVDLHNLQMRPLIQLLLTIGVPIPLDFEML